MDATERMLIERACEPVIASNCHFVDHGEATRIADLFSDEGRALSPLEGPAVMVNGGHTAI
jgi:hypothetical protein